MRLCWSGGQPPYVLVMSFQHPFLPLTTDGNCPCRLDIRVLRTLVSISYRWNLLVLGFRIKYWLSRWNPLVLGFSSKDAPSENRNARFLRTSISTMFSECSCEEHPMSITVRWCYFLKWSPNHWPCFSREERTFPNTCTLDDKLISPLSRCCAIFKKKLNFNNLVVKTSNEMHIGASFSQNIL